MTSQSAEELISVLKEQETRLVLESFTHDDAWRLGMLLVEMARELSPGPAPTMTRGSTVSDAWSSVTLRARSWWAHASVPGVPPSMSRRASTSIVLPPTEARSHCVPERSAPGPSVRSRFRAYPKRTTTR